MKMNANLITNTAFTAACLIVVLVGSMQLRDRFVAEATPTDPAGIADISGTISLETAPVQGDTMASVVIVEFSDFECPFCGRYAKDTYPVLKDEFILTGLARYAFVNLPLAIHREAEGAAAAAMCAHAQGRFWEMHSRLFNNQQLLSPPDLNEHASKLGLRHDVFEKCVAGEVSTLVRGDVELARRLGIQNTPTFLLGTLDADGTAKITKKILGAQPTQVFRDILQRLVKDVKAAT